MLPEPIFQQEFERLQKAGAETYTQSVYEDDVRFGWVLSGIETGEGQWLRLAQKMKPAADGAIAEDLQTSIAKALTVNAPSVLTILSENGGSSTWRIGVICSGPIPAPGKAWLKKYKAAALRSVTSVRDPKLVAQQAECLRALKRIDLSGPDDEYE